jgi:hypothetical protein
VPAWGIALIVLGVLAAAIAMGASVWRCVKERRARWEDESETDTQEEPLSPQSAHSHETA